MNLYKELLKLEFAGLINITPGGNLPTVANYAALPDATLHSGDKYLVLNGSGVWPINRKPAGIYYSDGATWTFVDEYVDIITGDVQAGDSKLFDGASLSTDNTLGGASPSDKKVPTEKAISEKMATIITGMPIGTVFFWPFREEDLPDCALVGKGQTLIRADYASLWSLAQHVTGTSRQQYGVGNGSTTFTLPDLRGEFLRGAYFGDVSASDWDVTTNDDVDLGRSDIPMGTPVVFSIAPCTGITAGTIYYLALRTGNKYCLFDTEAHANANGATGKVALSGTPVDSSYTTAGLPQGSAMQEHIHLQGGNCPSGEGNYGTVARTRTRNEGDFVASVAVDYAPKTSVAYTDGTHGTPSTSDESRSRNTQGIWCIQVTNGEIAAEDRTSIEQRLTDLENAYINNKYETGWINRSDWTNVHLGSSTTKNADSNVTHNLGKHLKDLHVRVLISPTGSDADCFEIKVSPDCTDNSYGFLVSEVDDDNVKIQSGSSGVLYLSDDGSGTAINTQDWYYKIIVVAHNAYTFVDARSDGNRCRAWVNFNGTGTVAIRASENVDGITDNATGDYTINWTSGTVPDENYAVVATTGGTAGAYIFKTYDEASARTAAGVRLYCIDLSWANVDPAQVSVSIFR